MSVINNSSSNIEESFSTSASLMSSSSDSFVDPFAPFLERQPFLLLDGGFATTLEWLYSVHLKTSLWSAEYLDDNTSHLDKIRGVHQHFLAEAQVDLLTSASYQCWTEGIMKAMKVDEKYAQEIMKRSVNIAVEERDKYWNEYLKKINGEEEKHHRLQPLVGISVGCYGATLANGAEYTGKYDINLSSLVNFHRNRLLVFLSSTSKFDWICLETIPSALEVEAITALFSDRTFLSSAFTTMSDVNRTRFSPSQGIGFTLSLSCKDGETLNDGTAVKSVLENFLANEQQMRSAGFHLLAISFNCLSPQYISSLFRLSRSLLGNNWNEKKRPYLMAYPNSGEEWNSIEKCWKNHENINEDEKWKKWIEEWYEIGGRILGGCCRCNAKQLKFIRKVITEFVQTKTDKNK